MITGIIIITITFCLHQLPLHLTANKPNAENRILDFQIIFCSIWGFNTLLTETIEPLLLIHPFLPLSCPARSTVATSNERPCLR